MISPHLEVVAQMLQKYLYSLRFDGLDSERIDAKFAGVFLDVRVSLLKIFQRAQACIETARCRRRAFLLPTILLLSFRIMERLIRHLGGSPPDSASATRDVITASSLARSGSLCRITPFASNT